jgi:hypothetical protein
LNYVVEIGRSQEQYAVRSKQRDRVQPQVKNTATTKLG